MDNAVSRTDVDDGVAIVCPDDGDGNGLLNELRPRVSPAGVDCVDGVRQSTRRMTPMSFPWMRTLS